jgi:purine-binding chemotaxis protein CheW
MKSDRRGPASPKATLADWEALRARLEVAREALDRAWTPDRAAAERILRSRARALARPAASPPGGEAIDVLEFRLAGETYAIEPHHVREVLPLATLVALPGVPDVVRGVANVRGEIISVIDLRRLFGLPEHGLGEIDYAVVLQSPSMAFAILADAIDGLRRIPRAAIQVAPPALGDANTQYLLGVTGWRTAVLDGGRLLADAVRLAEATPVGRGPLAVQQPTASASPADTNREGESLNGFSTCRRASSCFWHSPWWSRWEAS